MKSKFAESIVKFNQMYGLAVNEVPTIPFTKSAELGSVKEQLINRLRRFTDILNEELNEAAQIIAKIEAGDSPPEVLTDIADWLGDIQVYCASEMAKFGLDNDLVLDTIMASNMSKLGADGKPIYDERGKVLKGPNYWRPEPMLLRYIEAAIRQVSIKLPGRPAAVIIDDLKKLGVY